MAKNLGTIMDMDNTASARLAREYLPDAFPADIADKIFEMVLSEYSPSARKNLIKNHIDFIKPAYAEMATLFKSTWFAGRLSACNS